MNPGSDSPAARRRNCRKKVALVLAFHAFSHLAPAMRPWPTVSRIRDRSAISPRFAPLLILTQSTLYSCVFTHYSYSEYIIHILFTCENWITGCYSCIIHIFILSFYKVYRRRINKIDKYASHLKSFLFETMNI